MLRKNSNTNLKYNKDNKCKNCNYMGCYYLCFIVVNKCNTTKNSSIVQSL